MSPKMFSETSLQKMPNADGVQCNCTKKTMMQMYITFIYIHVDHCLNVQKMMVLLSIAFSVQVLTREVSTYKNNC